MINLQLEEGFRTLEKNHDVPISTKYTAQNVLIHTMETYVSSGKHKNRVARMRKLIEDSYREGFDYYNDFDAVNSRWSSSYDTLIKSYKPLFDTTRDDLARSAVNISAPREGPLLSLVLDISNGFPTFVRQLRRWCSSRAPPGVDDEYDVRSLIYVLLTLHFNDIGAEKYTPSPAGAVSRQDFPLKKKKIVMEMKKARKSLGVDKVGGELPIDMMRYRAHQDCDMLILFVYDPDCCIDNPLGVKTNLESKDAEGKIKVVIMQF